jgi:polyisoprenyl-phosphate glycosyltransferase
LIPKLIQKWEKGYNMVLGQYKKTEGHPLMIFMRRIFYFLFEKMSNIEVPINATGFGLIDRRVIDALRSLPEKYRFGRGLMMWVGFRKAFVPYKRQERIYGKSSYNFFGYLKDAERAIFGFSYLHLDLIVYAGFIITILSFIFIVGYLFTVIIFGNPIKASITLMLATVFFGGINLMALSIIGKYVQVIVEESKNRPLYMVEKVIGQKINAKK